MKKQHGRIHKKKKNDQGARTPTHQGYHRASQTHKAASTTLKRSPEDAARFVEDAVREWPTADRPTRHQECPKLRHLALCCEHVTASKQFSKTFDAFFGDRRAVAHIQTQCATNAPPTPAPQVRKALPALPLARSEACVQPTNSSNSRVAFRRS